jgi:LPS export ABC transporter protein LptC
MRLIRSVAAVCVVLLAGACSLNYQATEVEAGATDNIPDTIIKNITYRVVKNSHTSLQLEAARSETYVNRKETLLSGAHFVEFDVKGDPDTDGRADSVVFHTDSQNAEISGSVLVYSAAQKGSISTEYLSWEDAGKTLTADPNERVIVKKDDGSYIVGRGFIGDFRIREVRFSGPVEGTYVYEEK